MVKTKLENPHHWKTYYDHNYIGGFSLKDMDAVVTITKWAEEIVENKAKSTKSNKFILYVKDQNGEEKMIVNKTNGKAIEKALETPNPDDWIGKQIQLYTERVRAFGDEHDALRVRSTKPELITAITKLKTVEELKDFYTKNKHLGGEFNTLVTNHKKKLENAT